MELILCLISDHEGYFVPRKRFFAVTLKKYHVFMMFCDVVVAILPLHLYYYNYQTYSIMRIPTWVYVLLALAWITFFSYKYLAAKCGCFGTAVAAVGAAPSTGILDYRWGSESTVTGSGFDAYKTGIITKGGQGDTLVITGQYRADEKNTTKYANLGLARAEAARLLFLDKVPSARIRCASSLVTDDMNKTDLHTSADFTWIKAVVNMNEASIIESGDEISILFPTGSASKTANAKVDNFLAELCKKHKTSGAKLAITGHTDNKGKEAANVTLGQNRANSIRRVLRDCGIKSELITADSKGPAQPVASNDTEEGRYQNRRVVIKIAQ
jgi:outer membrane protein OmpA-like peptidoglycan-associated protein